MCVCVCVMEEGGIPYVACAGGKWVTLLLEQTWEDEGSGSAGPPASQVTPSRLRTEPPGK